MHGAGAREPRRSGNPFLDDTDDDDDGGAGSSGVTAAPGPAFPAFTTLPPEASQSSTASLQSPQDTSALVSMPAKQPTDSQATTQQSVGTAAAAAAVQQHTPVAHTAVVSSDVAPGSALGMDRQASRQQSGQVSSRTGQVSDRAGQVSGIMQQGSSSHMPTTPHPPRFPTQQPTGNQPQAPSLPTEPAVPSNRSEATAAAAYAGAWQQGSTGVGSASDRQANVPFVQEAVPVAKPNDRQPLPAAPPLQPSQAPAGSLQEVQALQPPEQGSQAAPLSLQRLDSWQQGASTGLRADAQAQSTPETRDVLVPPGHTRAASRQAQAGMSTSAQGPVNRGSADPALPFQQQSSFLRAPPPTASMPVYATPFTGDPLPSRGGQQEVSVLREHEATGLGGMLGRSAPDSDTEEEESAASSQDRQKFMKSLQSPDQGSSRSRNLVQGFGRMRAKAKDMLQAKNAGSPSGPNTRSAQQAPSQGSADDASHTPTDVELGKRGRLARDMTLMFGLKKPANQQ